MALPQRGDEAELFESFNRTLLRTVRRRVNRVPDAMIEDACATAWMKFLRCQPDRDGPWKGWLVRVAINDALALDRAEHGVRHLGAGEEMEHRDVVAEPADPRPSPQIERLELREALELLSRVPERRREAVVLQLAGLKYNEIAEALGLSYTRVNALLAEGHAHVRGDVHAREATWSQHPRVARLQQLEEAPPQWLTNLLGKVPGSHRSAALLAWRRAALAVEDYRVELGAQRLEDGLGTRPSRPDAARRYDRATDTIAHLQQSRQLEHGRSLER
jgi:RNA polymerase sigma factor (sigma-70 family)